MMNVTLIARATDGMLLVETWDDEASQVLAPFKKQAKELLGGLWRLHHGAPPRRCSLETNSGDVVFHYTIDDGIIYLSICEASYPTKLAFAFLEEVQSSFITELQREFGSGSSVNLRSQVETIQKPYYFVRFDRVIQRKRQDFRDPNSSKALSRVNESLLEVSQIMRRNLNDIVQRGERLDEVARKGSDLNRASREFKGMARLLRLQVVMRKYAALAVILLLVLGTVYVKSE